MDMLRTLPLLPEILDVEAPPRALDPQASRSARTSDHAARMRAQRARKQIMPSTNRQEMVFLTRYDLSEMFDDPR